MLCCQIVNAQCGESGHSINAKDSWLSCERSLIPNSNDNEEYHWIYYDLGYEYPIGTLQIWNYNVENETGNGIKDGELFYSEDGQNWVSNGLFQIPASNGQNDYEGWSGINLSGKNARHILLVAYSNWENSNCIGLSEVRFNITEPITSTKKSKIVATTLNVFPNPVNQVLTIELNDQTVMQELVILNNTGHEIWRKNGNQTNWKVDVNRFPAGMYFVKIWTDEQQYATRKFIKAKL